MDEWERQRQKWKGGVKEGEKGETQRPTSTHLMLPAGPGDADSTVLLIHSPSPARSHVFCSRSLPLLPTLFVTFPDLSPRPLGWPCESGVFPVIRSSLLMHMPSATECLSWICVHYVILHMECKVKGKSSVPQGWVTKTRWMDVVALSKKCPFLQAVLTLWLPGLHVLRKCHWVTLTPISLKDSKICKWILILYKFKLSLVIVWVFTKRRFIHLKYDVFRVKSKR